jgi:DNA-binding transcriptional LysR family regulator
MRANDACVERMLVITPMNSAHAFAGSLDLLVALDALLVERSVTRAARRLGVTQSALSHKLAKIREAVGDPLFVVSGRSLLLTARAEALAHPLSEALAQLRGVTAIGKPFEPRTATRHFVVATIDYGEFTMLSRVLDIARREAPLVTFAIEAPGRDLAQRLAQGAVDLAVGGPSVISMSSTAAFRRRLIYREGFVVVGRKGHPGLRGRLTLERYVELPHLVIAPLGMPGAVVDAALEKRGLKRRVALRVASFVAAPFLVARSDLILTAPALLIDEAAKHVELTRRPPPLPLPEQEVFAVWHERAQHDQGHSWLRSILDRVADPGLVAPKRGR